MSISGSSSRLKEWAILPVAALIFMVPALYNGFPIVTPDSGAYINNAFELSVPLDRPLGYSLFIRLTSMEQTLWAPVVVQGLILAFLLRLLCRHYLKAHYSNYIFLAVSLMVLCLTGSAWFCSQLMPDIFTAILLLAVLAWFTVPFACSWHKWMLGAFIFCVLMLHNSHAMILILFSLVLIVFSIVRNRNWLRGSIVLLSLGIAALLGFSMMNAVAGRGFRPSAASGVFLMCRLVESGVMDKFLAENCSNNEYNLCPYKDELPRRQWGFMWDEQSPLNKTGGWEANEQHYQQIERKVLTTPKYLVLFLFKSGQATLRQLPQLYLGDGTGPQAEGAQPYEIIKYRYPYELKEYRASLQNDGVLPLPVFNVVIISSTIFLLISCLLAAGRFKQDLSASWKNAFGLILLYLVCNAAITASFSTVLGRFEARVFWVLPFFCMLFLLQALLRKTSK